MREVERNPVVSAIGYATVSSAPARTASSMASVGRAVVFRQLMNRFASLESVPDGTGRYTGSCQNRAPEGDERADTNRPAHFTVARWYVREKRDWALPLSFDALQIRKDVAHAGPALARHVHVAHRRSDEQIDFVRDEVLKCQRMLNLHLSLHMVDGIAHAWHRNAVMASHSEQYESFR
jgi:hypothetical protein